MESVFKEPHTWSSVKQLQIQYQKAWQLRSSFNTLSVLVLRHTPRCCDRTWNSLKFVCWDWTQNNQASHWRNHWYDILEAISKHAPIHWRTADTLSPSLHRVQLLHKDHQLWSPQFCQGSLENKRIRLRIKNLPLKQAQLWDFHFRRSDSVSLNDAVVSLFSWSFLSLFCHSCFCRYF